MKTKKYKCYSIYVIYRGIQIEKFCIANSRSEAAAKLNVSGYMIKNYGYANEVETPFDGILAQMESGRIIFQEGRKDLCRKKIPLSEMEQIIDKSQDAYYKKGGLIND